jgi:hypothetical protein
MMVPSLCIIDFDDSIFPTTGFVQTFSDFPFDVDSAGQVSICASKPLEVSPAWKTYLDQLAIAVQILLVNAQLTAEKVVFVTNSSPGWIDAVTTHFLPSLLWSFAGIPQYHCRHRYPYSAYPKYHAVLDLLELYQPGRVIGIGDQQEDYLSVAKTCRPWSITTHFIKLPYPCPSPDDFIGHIRQTSSYLHTLTSNFDNHVFIEIQEKNEPDNDFQYE